MAFEEIIAPLTTLAIFIYLVILAVYIAILISTLVHQAKRGRWIWFVFTILVNVVLWVYWIIWIFSKKFRRKKKTKHK